MSKNDWEFVDDEMGLDDENMMQNLKNDKQNTPSINAEFQTYFFMHSMISSLKTDTNRCLSSNCGKL